jgi:hypothetical protein
LKIALERQIEAANAESRRTLIAEREKYEIKERSLQTKYSDMELDLTRQKGELRYFKNRWPRQPKNELRDRFSDSKSKQVTGQRFSGPIFKQESRTGFSDEDRILDRT